MKQHHGWLRGWRRLVLVISSVGLFLAVAGCVRRTVTINTDPQGATVVLNDQQLGTSPMKVDFTWYGDYDVIVRKEGYETLETNHRLEPPWYQVPPIDLFAEAFVPFVIHDQQEMNFSLEPRKPVDEAALLQDAAEIRERTLYGSD